MKLAVQQDLKRERGAVLRRVRQEAGLSAKKLADRINARTPGSDLTDNAIYAYESGRVLLSRESAERISAVLKVPMGELLVGDPDYTGPDGGAAMESAATESVPNRGGHLGCQRLHPPVVDVLRTARTLTRMLGVSRFELASPVGFLHGFELLARDGQRVLQHDDVTAARQGASNEAHDAIDEVARSVTALLQHAASGYETLRQAGQAGSCVAASRELATALSKDVADLTTAHQGLIVEGGLKPGLPESEAWADQDLSELTPWAKLER